MDTHLPSILCVDDDPAVLDLLKEYFTLQGFVVLTATNGVEAFLQVKQWMPRAVVMDLFMPRLGGIGALGRIKAMQPEICVIMVTAIEEIESAQTALGLGASDYVTKPFSLQYLDSVLEVHLLMDRINPDSK